MWHVTQDAVMLCHVMLCYVGGPGAPGSVVGYHVRLDAAVTQDTQLLFCTTGILLRRWDYHMLFRDQEFNILTLPQFNCYQLVVYHRATSSGAYVWMSCIVVWILCLQLVCVDLLLASHYIDWSICIVASNWALLLNRSQSFLAKQSEHCEAGFCSRDVLLISDC